VQSIFHLSFLRGLFPESSFKGVDMRNMDGEPIQSTVALTLRSCQPLGTAFMQA
jgi:hypothetical protein